MGSFNGPFLIYRRWDWSIVGRVEPSSAGPGRQELLRGSAGEQTDLSTMLESFGEFRSMWRKN